MAGEAKRRNLYRVAQEAARVAREQHDRELFLKRSAAAKRGAETRKHKQELADCGMLAIDDSSYSYYKRACT